jgi:hypothetical protein
MDLKCACGNVMSDVGSPNETEHLLVSSRSIERLQDSVDTEVESDKIVDGWPEHWEKSGATEVWKCHVCKRLYISPKGTPSKVVVYAIEKIGVTPKRGTLKVTGGDANLNIRSSSILRPLRLIPLLPAVSDSFASPPDSLAQLIQSIRAQTIAPASSDVGTAENDHARVALAESESQIARKAGIGETNHCLLERCSSNERRVEHSDDINPSLLVRRWFREHEGDTPGTPRYQRARPPVLSCPSCSFSDARVSRRRFQTRAFDDLGRAGFSAVGPSAINANRPTDVVLYCTLPRPLRLSPTPDPGFASRRRRKSVRETADNCHLAILKRLW